MNRKQIVCMWTGIIIFLLLSLLNFRVHHSKAIGGNDTLYWSPFYLRSVIVYLLIMVPITIAAILSFKKPT